MAGLVRVTFAPSGATAWVESGTTVMEAAVAAGIFLVATCGRRGVCGACGVRLEQGELDAPDEQEAVALRRAPSDVRLACKARISASVTVRPVVHVSDEIVTSTRGSTVIAGVDLGTTTVACSAVEVEGRELGIASTSNRQSAWGGDVLSRIAAAVSEGEALRDAAVRSVRTAVAEASGGARVSRVAIAGNSAMAGLLAGVDVSGLGTHPFTAPNLGGDQEWRPRLASDLGVHDVELLAPLAAFVGGDTLGGLIYTGMLYDRCPALFVDLGTNAEIVVTDGETLWLTSAAAGPAFEASGVEAGGPAVAGAVTCVSSDGERYQMETIGGQPPRWFSGSGLVSALARLLEAGALASDGALVQGIHGAARVSRDGDGMLRARFDGLAPEMAISQLDVRALQLAKAAVRVGIQSVVKASTMAVADIAVLRIAGAFGAAVSASDLVALGVIPAALGSHASFVGNASLGGAVSVALDPDVLDDARTRTARLVHVELAQDPAFNDSLLSALELAPYSL